MDVATTVRSSAKRTREIFAADFASPTAALENKPSAADQISVSSRIRNEYDHVRELPPALAAKMASATSTAVERRKKIKAQNAEEKASDPQMEKMIEGASERADQAKSAQSMALTLRAGGKGVAAPNANGPTPLRNTTSSALVRKDIVKQTKPHWHAPWKVMRVISGHMGWVRSVCLDPDNQFFATGSADRTIKIWSMVGQLKLTLTGHISAVRGLAISDRHPYLFSCGEDKQVKCWDLETNKVIRHYHGHLSGVYALAVHPTLDVLCTGGRDGVVRVWDMRTRTNVHVLSGHKGTISSVLCQSADPQVISGSMDGTIRLWDLAAGKSQQVLTHHKKSVRALALNPNEWTFASGSSQSIKGFKFPDGALMNNYEGHNSIINTLSINEDNIMFSGGDDGSLAFWDYPTGHCYQKSHSIAQPGSLDAEAGVMCSTFDKTGLRLITGESDKSIKIWKQDETADEDSFPLDWQPTLGRRKY